MAGEKGRSRPSLAAQLFGGWIMNNPFIHPKVRAQYLRVNPEVDDLPLGLSGTEAVLHEAEHLGRRTSYAMENLGYWVNLVRELLMTIIPSLSEAGNLANAISAEVRAGSEAVRAAQTTVESGVPQSVARTLGCCRDEALRITEKLEAQVIKEGGQLTPMEKGEVMDALTKAIARNAMDKGTLPRTLRIAPAPSSITGEAPPKVRMPDFWDTKGTSYDVMTASVKGVVEHDRRYIWTPQNPLTMPDGTSIKNVLPILYPAQRRPWGLAGPLLRGSNLALKGPGLRSQLRAPSSLGVGFGVKTAADVLRQSQQALLEEQRRLWEQQRRKQKEQRERQERQQKQEQQMFQRRRVGFQKQQQQMQSQRKDRKRREQETLQRKRVEQQRLEQEKKLLRERQERMRRTERSRPLQFLPFGGRPIRGGSAIPGIGPVHPQASSQPPVPGGLGGISRGPGLQGLHKVTGSVSEGSGFTVSGSFGSPSYQRSILRGLSSPPKAGGAKK